MQTPVGSERRIRVVHVLCALERGGAERLVLDLCRRLEPSRFELAVATVMGGGPLEEPLRALGIPVMLGRRRPGRPGLRALMRLRAFFGEFQPDIVHTHLFAGDTWGRLAALSSSRPILISTEHNINLEESWHHRLAKRRLAGFTDRIVAVSEAVRESAVRLEGLPADRFEVIPNGIDLERFPPVRVGDPGPGHRLITVGRLVPQKGIDVLIDALVLTPAVIAGVTPGVPPDVSPGLTLTVVGDGPMREALEARARTLGVAHRVRFVGDQADVGPWLQAADILVQPSRWEGFGLTVVEAMATGLPVVASRVGGLEALVLDGRTGRLVEPGSPLALAGALLELSSADLRSAFGAAGAARARALFGIEAVARRYEALYLRCIAGRSVIQ